MTKEQGEDAPSKFLADQYRREAFKLLDAARKLTEITAALKQTKVRVSRPAVDDVAAARTLLADLPGVRSLTTLEKV